MPSKDGDLVSKLTARLSEEIQNLPKDGTEHQLTINIKGNRGNINLGRQTFDINTTPTTAQPHPPSNNRNTQKICMACLGIAALSFTLKDHLPEALKAYALIATGAFGCVAFMLMASH